MSSKDPQIPNTTVDVKFEEFMKFIKSFNVEYRNMDEFQIRYKIFLASLKEIDEENKDPKLQTAKFGINQFADRTKLELKSMTGGLNPPGKQQSSKH